MPCRKGPLSSATRSGCSQNGRGPRAGEVEQWDRWDRTRPRHERGKGAFVPQGFVGRDEKRIRSTDEAKLKARGRRGGRKTSSPHSRAFGRQTRLRKKTGMSRFEGSSPSTAKARHRAPGHEAQSEKPTKARNGGEQVRSRREAQNTGMNTVSFGHWQHSQGRWPFAGIR